MFSLWYGSISLLFQSFCIKLHNCEIGIITDVLNSILIKSEVFMSLNAGACVLLTLNAHCVMSWHRCCSSWKSRRIIRFTSNRSLAVVWSMKEVCELIISDWSFRNEMSSMNYEHYRYAKPSHSNSVTKSLIMELNAHSNRRTASNGRKPQSHSIHSFIQRDGDGRIKNNAFQSCQQREQKKMENKWRRETKVLLKYGFCHRHFYPTRSISWWARWAARMIIMADSTHDSHRELYYSANRSAASMQPAPVSVRWNWEKIKHA